MLILEEERRAVELVKKVKECYKDPLKPNWYERIKVFLRKDLNCSKDLRIDPREFSGTPFLGGYLSLDEGLAVPYSVTKGLTPIAILLSEKLKGIYGDGNDPGGILWESYKLRMDVAVKELSKMGLEDEALAQEAAARSTKIWPLISILTAEDVTEGYTYLGGPLFLDHVTKGRVRVKNYVMDRNDLDRLITLIEADPLASAGLDRPFNEIDLKLGEYHFRISLDTPPASPGAVDLRTLSAISRLSLPRLIELGTITMEQAALILERIMRGEPVLIFGRTGVGKTTLSNALLASLPRDLRIVSMEEVREIEDMNRYGMHHTAYEVPNAKMEVLISLLHRNPDVVFMGEILTSDHILAFEFAMESGFSVLATTHARSYEHLTKKWEKVSPDSLDGVIGVMMAPRRVKSIKINDSGWRKPGEPSNSCLRFIKGLMGARTNEEVRRRVVEAPDFC